MPSALLSDIIFGLMQSGQPFTDIHIETGMPIMLRQSNFNWVYAKQKDQPIVASREQIAAFINAIYLNDEKVPRTTTGDGWWARLSSEGSLHPAVNVSQMVNQALVSHRMRCTIQNQRMGDAQALVLRPLKAIPESMESLGLPFQVEKMLRQTYRGLIIVTGPTGSGKSTTLAAMVGNINRFRAANILTIEDPVEYLHERGMGIINQREVGIDVNSFAEGVRDALRFVPDVIMIGEIRDEETMRAALRAGESGHLVLSSMHAPTTVGAVRKMMAYVGGNAAEVQAITGALVAVIAQALLPDKAGSGGSHLAVEYLDCGIPKVVQALQEAVVDPKRLSSLEREIAGSGIEGALAMKASVRALITSGKIEPKQGLFTANTPEERMELLRGMAR